MAAYTVDYYLGNDSTKVNEGYYLLLPSDWHESCRLSRSLAVVQEAKTNSVK